MRGRTPQASIVAWVLFLGLAAVLEAVQGELPDFSKAAQGSKASVVLVEGIQESPIFPGQKKIVANTGFFVGSDGQVLTSLLAVSACPAVRVQTTDGRTSQARVKAFDQASGIVLLETDLKGTVPLEFGEEAPKPGEWALAVYGTRSPEGQVNVALQPGLVSSNEVSLKLFGARWDGLIAGDFCVRPGCAAAPLLDINGRLTGAVIAVSPHSEGTACCYGLPAKSLKPIVSDLMQGKSKQLGWLGLAVARSGDKEGLSVAGVLEGSPGRRVGIQPGDVLLEIDGEVISEPLVFESKVTRKAPGSLVKLSLLRGEEVKTAEIEVGARPLLVSRFPAPVRSEIRFYREFFATVPDAEVQALQENIQQLQRENDELRAHLVELEKRLHEMEKGRK